MRARAQKHPDPTPPPTPDLDRYYVKHHSVPGLEESGLRSFYANVFEECKQNVCAAMLAEVNKEREGQTINQGLVKVRGEGSSVPLPICFFIMSLSSVCVACRLSSVVDRRSSIVDRRSSIV